MPQSTIKFIPNNWLNDRQNDSAILPIFKESLRQKPSISPDDRASKSRSTSSTNRPRPKRQISRHKINKLGLEIDIK